MSDPTQLTIDERIREMQSKIENVYQVTIHAHHSVPFYRAFKQWDTNGDLLIWVNRGFIHDASRPVGHLSPLELINRWNSGIPVFVY